MTIDTGYINPRHRNFSFRGQAQQFVVPAGVTEIVVEAWGASSGKDDYVAHGGYAATRLVVTPGEILYVYVGGNNGFNGGGAATAECVGAGASDIRQGGSFVMNRQLVGAGAGGPTKFQVG